MVESTEHYPSLHTRLRMAGWTIRYGKIVVHLYNPELNRYAVGHYPDDSPNPDGSLDLVGLEDGARQL